jgi:SAM-dependent methyltransferase
MADAVHRFMAALCFASAAALPPAHADCGAPPGVVGMQEAEVLYLPTPRPVVEAMLKLAGVTGNDVVYDLGAGDGRIPIAAAHIYGARGVGIELDGRMIERARCHAREAGVEGRVEFRQQDLFGADLREATVVTLFLFPQMIVQLGPKLRAELRPGTRIVSHRFGFGDWPPDRTIEVDGHAVLLWRVP